MDRQWLNTVKILPRIQQLRPFKMLTKIRKTFLFLPKIEKNTFYGDLCLFDLFRIQSLEQKGASVFGQPNNYCCNHQGNRLEILESESF